jgi:hypothetical protein
MKINSFSDVREFLSDIPNINNGGCGIATLAMFLWLKKNKGIKKGVRVAYLYKYDDDYEKYQFKVNNSNLKGNTTRVSSCNHAVLTVDKKVYFDCADSYICIDNFKKKIVIPYRKTEQFLTDSLRNEDDWNFLFSRSRYVPMIERVLDIKLNL